MGDGHPITGGAGPRMQTGGEKVTGGTRAGMETGGEKVGTRAGMKMGGGITRDPVVFNAATRIHPMIPSLGEDETRCQNRQHYRKNHKEKCVAQPLSPLRTRQKHTPVKTAYPLERKTTAYEVINGPAGRWQPPARLAPFHDNESGLRNG